MYGAILAGQYVFLLAFLQILMIYFSNVSLLSNSTPTNFSHLLFLLYCMFLSCHVRVSEWIHTL